MRKTLATVAATLLLGVSAIGIKAVSAAPISLGEAVAKAAKMQQGSLLTQVQRAPGKRGAKKRGGGGGNRGGGQRRGGFDPGAAAAIGIIGAIGTAIAIDAARQSAVTECRRRYGRRYDAETGMVYSRRGDFPCPD